MLCGGNGLRWIKSIGYVKIEPGSIGTPKSYFIMKLADAY